MISLVRLSCTSQLILGRCGLRLANEGMLEYSTVLVAIGAGESLYV